MLRSHPPERPPAAPSSVLRIYSSSLSPPRTDHASSAIEVFEEGYAAHADHVADLNEDVYFEDAL